MINILLQAARLLVAMAFVVSISTARANPPQSSSVTLPDSDHDGLDDALEQRLLDQFAPTFLVSAHDCSALPAEFRPALRTPQVQAENGVIYGQVVRAHGEGTERSPLVEVHFFHLWRRDCGGHGHPLDTEHVAVLVRASSPSLATASWKALYWYAAAHENTVCDVSQIARAATLHAEDHGAKVWISAGKHASYLDPSLCARGCGADRCDSMEPLPVRQPVNLGEPGSPMNGSLFIASPAWPLLAKMSATNFPPAPVARLEELPASDIAWFNPGRHPAQGVIARSSSTEQAIAGGGHNTTAAISLAGRSTGDALASSGDNTEQALAAANTSTSDALHKSYDHTRDALSHSALRVGRALHVISKEKKKDGQPH